MPKQAFYTGAVVFTLVFLLAVIVNGLLKSSLVGKMTQEQIDALPYIQTVGGIAYLSFVAIPLLLLFSLFVPGKPKQVQGRAPRREIVVAADPEEGYHRGYYQGKAEVLEEMVRDMRGQRDRAMDMLESSNEAFFNLVGSLTQREVKTLANWFEQGDNIKQIKGEVVVTDPKGKPYTTSEGQYIYLDDRQVEFWQQMGYAYGDMSLPAFKDWVQDCEHLALPAPRKRAQ